MTIANVPASPRTATRTVRPARGGAARLRGAGIHAERGVSRPRVGEPDNRASHPPAADTIPTGARYGRQNDTKEQRISEDRRYRAKTNREEDLVKQPAERPGQTTPQRPVRSSA
ncbi:hypothetical protein MSAS_07030 [Mycobacterium saskatchewanense]|nr:hypothetical protein MSAS_07030 [Mycobacterium saskatchewanense]